MSHIEIKINSDSNTSICLCKIKIYNFQNDNYYVNIFKLSDLVYDSINKRLRSYSSQHTLINTGIININSEEYLIKFLMMILEEYDNNTIRTISINLNTNIIFIKQLLYYYITNDIKDILDMYNNINVNERQLELKKYILNNSFSSIFPKEILQYISSYMN